jgi:hypothetical protein
LMADGLPPSTKYSAYTMKATQRGRL